MSRACKRSPAPLPGPLIASRREADAGVRDRDMQPPPLRPECLQADPAALVARLDAEQHGVLHKGLDQEWRDLGLG